MFPGKGGGHVRVTPLSQMNEDNVRNADGQRPS